MSNDGMKSPSNSSSIKGGSSARRQQKYQAAQAQITSLLDKNSELKSQLIKMEKKCEQLVANQHRNGKISAILSEASSRVSADTSLTTRVSTEEVTRASADASLTTRLSSEEDSRSSA